LEKLNNLAIIPARGGSKRIPRKNIKDFLGKPIIAYSIEAAINSNLFCEVMVSTEDSEIAEIAREHGASVPFYRSAKNASDFATTIDVINEVLFEYKNKLNKVFEFVFCIYPTAPLIQLADLIGGYELLKTNEFDSVFPIVQFSYPVQRGLIISDEMTLSYLHPEFEKKRSQDLSKVYHDAGQWYAINPAKIKKSLMTDNSGYFLLDETHVQDIDNQTDWELTELKYKMIN